MPDYILTTFFRQASRGWTESFYKNASGHSVVQDAYVNNLAVPRIAMCGSGVEIYAIRTSDIAILRDSRLQGAAFVAPNNLAADYPGLGVQVELSSGVIYKRQQIFRGPPDDWLLAGAISGSFVIAPAWRTAFNTFRTALLAGSWSLRVIDREDATNPAKQISSLSQLAAGVVTITTLGNHNLQATDRVLISGCVGATPETLSYKKKPRGNYQVMSVPSATTFTIPESLPDLYTYKGKGTARKVVYKLATIDDTSVREPRTKRTGRVPFVPRGRRSVRRP